MKHFENVTVLTKANIYFDGKCVSHTIECSDGSKKTLGVIFPGRLTFNTNAPERMQITDGTCRVRIAQDPSSQQYQAGQSFSIPANSSFEIETEEVLNYICHFE
ncbi:MAG: pyrimidine/purine nucleoside phosphorylase [Pseudomonadota bacterium]|nr:pyrimidine/purine nucleoside phosphorylase [Pseudomonadota bacterium]